MPVAVRPVEAPPRDTYGRALRRYDRDPRLPWRFATYAVNLVAKPVNVNGVVAPTLFFPATTQGAAAAQRAQKMGWKDETEALHAHEAAVAAHVPAPPAPPMRKLTGEALLEHLRAMDYNAMRAIAKERDDVSGRLPRELLEVELAKVLDASGGLSVPLEE